MSTGNTYHKVCTIEDIPKNTGVCALIEGKQIAIFRVGEENHLYAIDNMDPFSNANVLSRGIVGSKDGTPIYKQQFSLESGECLDDSEKSVSSYPIREQDGVVYLSAFPV